MVHKDPEKRREYIRQYQLVWMWRRRMTWILDNGPCNTCGSVKDLLVSFKDLDQKAMKVASIWSRSDERRFEVLAGCEVLCKDCHNQKVATWRRERKPHEKTDQHPASPRPGTRRRGSLS